MDAGVFRRVKSALKSRNYNMNDSWLRDCLEYCATEISSTDLEKMLEFITTQWHLSDLKEINNEQGCLPPNLSQQSCTTLTGKYILQMNKMYDISTPKFKQLEQIKNVSTDNIEATEADNMQEKTWEPKSKRMYQLFLTDGRQDVTAVEYKAIRMLNDNPRILPGFKFLIKGPVKCRRGIIMLEEANLAEVAGEVDSLLIPNALENVLARALNLAENPNPYNDQNELEKCTNSEVDVTQTRTQNLVPNAPLQNSNRQTQNVRNSSLQKQNVQSTNQAQTINPMRRESTQISNTGQTSEMDDFPDDEELMEFMTQDTRWMNSVPGTNDKSDKQKAHQKIQTINPTRRENTQIANTRQTSEMDDFPGDDELMELMTQDSSWMNSVPGKQKAQQQIQTVNPRRENPQTSNSGQAAAGNYSTIDEEEGFMDQELDWTNVVPEKNKSDNFSIQKSMEFPDDDMDFNIDFDNFQSTVAAPTSTVNRGNDGNKIVNAGVKKTWQPPQMNHDRTKATENPVIKKSAIMKPLIPQRKFGETSSVKRKNDVLSPPVQKTAPKVKRVPEPTNTRKITDFILQKPPPKICDFLSDILKEPLETSKPITRTIRGKMVGILTKLDIANSKWHLAASLTDSTAKVDVDFSSEVLERIFGMSVQDFIEKRKKSKGNPEMMQKLKSDISQAEGKLQKLDALVELQFTKDKKPYVTKISDLSEQQKRLIDQQKQMRSS